MKNKYALHSQKCPKWPFFEVFFYAFLSARLQGPKNMIFGFSMKFPFRKGMSQPDLKILFFRPLESIFFPSCAGHGPYLVRNRDFCIICVNIFLFQYYCNRNLFLMLRTLNDTRLMMQICFALQKLFQGPQGPKFFKKTPQ